MIVVTAEPDDLAGFHALAAEVEPWFGPMVDDPDFKLTVDRAIGHRTALCVRADDGPGLLGGLLLTGGYPVYRIGWLVVAAAARRRGVARALVCEAVRELMQRPCRVEVLTFGEDHRAAEPSGARAFYEQLGFRPGGPAPAGPDGGSRQWLRRTLNSGRAADPLQVVR
jgi:ribosomal protein S18 acetylase RimI-like enzyme